MAVDPALPVLNVGSRDKPVYLPMEVCEPEPGQRAITQLSSEQTRRMLRYAVIGRKPAHNAELIVTQGAAMLGLGTPQNPTLVRNKFPLLHHRDNSSQ